MKTRRIRRSPWTVPLLNSTGLALLAAGAATWFLWPPPEPVARTQLYAALNPPSLLVAAETSLSGDAFLKNQGYIIKDPFVLNAALNDPSLANLTVLQEQTDQLQWLQWLESEVKVEFPGPEFIQISMSGDHPDQLLVIVQAIRKAYLDKTSDKEVRDREDQLNTLRDIYARWEKTYNTQRAKLRMLQDKGKGINEENLALLQKLYLQELNAAVKDLQKVRSDIRRLGIEIGLKPEWHEVGWLQIAASLNSTPAPLTPVNSALVALLHDEFLFAPSRYRPFVSQAQLDNDPIAAALLITIGKLKADIITARASSPSEEAFRKDSASLRSALELAQKELEQRHRELRSKLEADARARARNEGQANQSASLRDRYAVARELERQLREEIQKLHEATRDQNRVAVDLTDVKAEIAKAEDIMGRVGKKIDALEIERNAPPRIREFGDGSLYTPPAQLRIRIAVALTLAGLGALLLVLAWLRSRPSGRVSPGASSRVAHVSES
jgi:hypothetical protein